MRNQSVGLLLYNIRKLKVRDSLAREFIYCALFEIVLALCKLFKNFCWLQKFEQKYKKWKKKKRQNEKKMMGRFKLFGLGNEKFWLWFLFFLFYFIFYFFFQFFSQDSIKRKFFPTLFLFFFSLLYIYIK